MYWLRYGGGPVLALLPSYTSPRSNPCSSENALPESHADVGLRHSGVGGGRVGSGPVLARSQSSGASAKAQLPSGRRCATRSVLAELLVGAAGQGRERGAGRGAGEGRTGGVRAAHGEVVEVVGLEGCGGPCADVQGQSGWCGLLAPAVHAANDVYEAERE